MSTFMVPDKHLKHKHNNNNSCLSCTMLIGDWQIMNWWIENTLNLINANKYKTTTTTRTAPTLTYKESLDTQKRKIH